MRRTTSLAAATSLLAAGLASAQTSNTTCVDGLHIIVARGSEEDQGAGRMGSTANSTADRIDDSEVVPLVYPATFADYGSSVAVGAAAMQKAVTDYAEACPDGKIALMGYSQGAQLTLDALCGRAANETEWDLPVFEFNVTEPLDADIVEKNVLAVVLYGDPSHSTDHAWNEGTSSQDGLFARQNVTACEAYEDKIHAWCDTGDTYCDLGNDRDVHGNYFDEYDDEAVQFVVDRWGEDGGSSNDDNDDDGDKDDDDEDGDGNGNNDDSGDDDSAAAVLVYSRMALALAGFVAGLPNLL